MTIALHNPTGRSTRAAVVTFSEVKLFFSYNTLIGVWNSATGERGRVANTWGPTTGRHFRELGCDGFPIVDAATLETIAKGGRS